MDVKDLMIGDWMHSKLNDVNARVCCIECQQYNSVWLEGSENWQRHYMYEVEPIPLTPEILEKNGWVRTKYAYGRDCMEIHGADKLPEGVDNALSMARWSIDKNYQYHFLDLYMWKGGVMQHDVHYVHQLQHAFRIFGIEREIKL